MSDEHQAAANTDREIWREREGDYYADSIHVTESGGIGINCGGMVFVKPVREWHRLAASVFNAEVCAACGEPRKEHMPGGTRWGEMSLCGAFIPQPAHPAGR